MSFYKTVVGITAISTDEDLPRLPLQTVQVSWEKKLSILEKKLNISWHWQSSHCDKLILQSLHFIRFQKSFYIQLDLTFKSNCKHIEIKLQSLIWPWNSHFKLKLDFNLLEYKKLFLKSDQITGTPTDNVVIEVFKVNGIPFDGVLSDFDIIDIWKCLGRDEAELDKTASEQVRKSCLRITYILKQPIHLTELSRKPEFSFDKKGSTRTDVYRARLCGYSDLAFNLGDTVTLTIQSTFFRISVEHMMAWIAPFGEIKSQPR